MRPAAFLRGLRAEIGEALGVHARGLDAEGRAAAWVLMYHRVLPADEARALHVEPGMFVRPETFRRHCRWLADDMRVLPLAELVDRLAAGRPIPPRACAITFDDGWRDNAVHAAPTLRAAGLPATLFLVTGRVGSGGAFWPDEVARRLALLSGPGRDQALHRAGLPGGAGLAQVLGVLKALPDPERARRLDALRDASPDPPDTDRELLDWEEVARMARDGVDFESHGHRHLLLTRVGADEARRDLGDARRTLRERGLGEGRLLAYPGGDHDARVRRLAAECGHVAAFTTGPGVLRAGDALHALARIGVHEDVSASRALLRRRLARAPQGQAHRSASGDPSRSAIRAAATSPPARK